MTLDNRGGDPTKQTKPATRGERFMDFCANVWTRLGDLFGVRPATIIGLTLGAIIFTSLLTYALVRSTENQVKITQIQSAFCNGTDPINDPANNARCRQLLDRLIHDPSPQQAQRLRQIVKEGS